MPLAGANEMSFAELMAMQDIEPSAAEPSGALQNTTLEDDDDDDAALLASQLGTALAAQEEQHRAQGAASAQSAARERQRAETSELLAALDFGALAAGSGFGSGAPIMLAQRASSPSAAGGSPAAAAAAVKQRRRKAGGAAPKSWASKAQSQPRARPQSAPLAVAPRPKLRPKLPQPQPRPWVSGPAVPISQLSAVAAAGGPRVAPTLDAAASKPPRPSSAPRSKKKRPSLHGRNMAHHQRSVDDLGGWLESQLNGEAIAAVANGKHQILNFSEAGPTDRSWSGKSSSSSIGLGSTSREERALRQRQANYLEQREREQQEAQQTRDESMKQRKAAVNARPWRDTIGRRPRNRPQSAPARRGKGKGKANAGKKSARPQSARPASASASARKVRPSLPRSPKRDGLTLEPQTAPALAWLELQETKPSDDSNGGFQSRLEVVAEGERQDWSRALSEMHAADRAQMLGEDRSAQQSPKKLAHMADVSVSAMLDGGAALGSPLVTVQRLMGCKVLCDSIAAPDGTLTPIAWDAVISSLKINPRQAQTYRRFFRQCDRSGSRKAKAADLCLLVSTLLVGPETTSGRDRLGLYYRMAAPDDEDLVQAGCKALFLALIRMVGGSGLHLLNLLSERLMPALAASGLSRCPVTLLWSIAEKVDALAALLSVRASISEKSGYVELKI